MKLYTIAEIAEILNLNARTVTYRFDRLSIKGEWLNRRYYFTEEQMNQINVRKNKMPNIPLYSDISFYKKQIQIIEMWKCQLKKNNREIARHFGYNEIFVCRVIKLFVNRDCIIIQSKINKNEKD